MRSFGWLILLGCALMSCSKKSPSKWEKSLESEDLQALLAGAKYQPDSDSLFLRASANQKMGTYTSDAHSIIYTFSLEAAVNEVANLDASPSFHMSLLKWSKLTPWWNKASDGVNFKHVNPLFIEWATAYLIPSPQEKIEDKSLQEWYNENFHHTVWTYLVTHHHLTKHALWEVEVGVYKESTKSVGFQPIAYFDDRFRGKFDDYDFPHKNHAFSASHAMSFWMRRKMDGSETACIQALETILDNFEPGWKEKLTSNSN